VPTLAERRIERKTAKQEAKERRRARRRARSPWSYLWRVPLFTLLSPFIATGFIVYAAYLLATWVLTPVVALLHLVGWLVVVPIALMLGKPRPRGPRMFTADYWADVHDGVRTVIEGVGEVLRQIAEIFS
jgi:hypothetical protein